jgi:hypothetical protein
MGKKKWWKEGCCGCDGDYMVQKYKYLIDFIMDDGRRRDSNFSFFTHNANIYITIYNFYLQYRYFTIQDTIFFQLFFIKSTPGYIYSDTMRAKLNTVQFYGTKQTAIFFPVSKIRFQLLYTYYNQPTSSIMHVQKSNTKPHKSSTTTTTNHTKQINN